HAAIHSMHAAHIRPPPFPTRRSSDLFCWPSPLHWQRFPADGHRARLTISLSLSALLPHETIDLACRPQAGGPVMSYLGVFMLLRDRKSTRLNSSHDQISYAAFCLKQN